MGAGVKMRILVTGGGGFLGTWIIKELLKNPTYLVTNFSRHNYTHLEDLGVPTIRGDISKMDDVEHALSQGFDAIFHVASLVGMWGKPEVFDSINISGTENLLSMAKKYGVKRFVYTSSPSVVFGRGGHAGADETLAYPTTHLCHYPRTKAIAEKMVLEANAGDFCTTALRPHLIWGPGDQNLLPRVIQKAREGKLKIIGMGENQVDIIYVEEAARAHVMAFEKLTPGSSVCGQAYFLGQGPIKLWQFIDQVLKLAEAPGIEKSLNLKIAVMIGKVMEALWKIAGLYSPEPPLTEFVALNLGTDHWFSHDKALRDFGWKPEISTEEGLKRLFAKRDGYRHLLTPTPG
jgi:2-alkyl-3-oxoalkanoate reductase